MTSQRRIRLTWLSLLLSMPLLAIQTAGVAAATLEVTGPPGAEVFVDGEAIGFLPFAGPLNLEPGSYVLRCELPGHQTFEMPVRMMDPDGHQTVLARLMPYSRRTAWTSNLVFAGLGQHYTDQRARGWIYNALEAGGLLTALSAELQRTNFRKDYLLLMDKYHQQINADEATAYRAEARAAYDDMEDMEKLRTTGLLVAGGSVLLSILDSLAFFPSAEVGPGSLTTSFSDPGAESSSHFGTIQLGYRASF